MRRRSASSTTRRLGSVGRTADRERHGRLLPVTVGACADRPRRRHRAPAPVTPNCTPWCGSSSSTRSGTPANKREAAPRRDSRSRRSKVSFADSRVGPYVQVGPAGDQRRAQQEAGDRRDRSCRRPARRAIEAPLDRRGPPVRGCRARASSAGAAAWWWACSREPTLPTASTPSTSRSVQDRSRWKKRMDSSGSSAVIGDEVLEGHADEQPQVGEEGGGVRRAARASGIGGRRLGGVGHPLAERAVLGDPRVSHRSFSVGLGRPGGSTRRARRPDAARWASPTPGSRRRRGGSGFEPGRPTARSWASVRSRE